MKNEHPTQALQGVPRSELILLLRNCHKQLHELFQKEEQDEYISFPHVQKISENLLQGINSIVLLQNELLDQQAVQLRSQSEEPQKVRHSSEEALKRIMEEKEHLQQELIKKL